MLKEVVMQGLARELPEATCQPLVTPPTGSTARLGTWQWRTGQGRVQTP